MNIIYALYMHAYVLCIHILCVMYVHCSTHKMKSIPRHLKSYANLNTHSYSWVKILNTYYICKLITYADIKLRLKYL